MLDQILWLGRVLSSRGMPRFLLQRHLEILHEELSRAVHEKVNVYDKLLKGADKLRESIHGIINEPVMESLVSDFLVEMGRPGDWAAREAGTLVVGAVADKQAGMDNADEALLVWLADPGRFSDQWAVAVRHLAQKAWDTVRPS
ncbi:MAG: hypothetical protein HQK55_12855 [Deltaproteobacteria bacterium]|nr:hypothetical protein [Deltaproteobacteria bacterium]